MSVTTGCGLDGREILGRRSPKVQGRQIGSWGCPLPNMGARGGVHAPHLAHRTSVISRRTSDGHRTDGHRTERDTLKSTYVKQLPLFGKATEVATIMLAHVLDFVDQVSLYLPACIRALFGCPVLQPLLKEA